MLTKSTKETFQTLAKSAKKVAIFEEIWADKFTPISIFEALSSELGEGVLLESGIQMPDMGHYSFLAFDPFAEVRAYGLDVKKIVGKEITEQKANPFDVLRGMLKDHSCTFSNQDPDNFVGNIIGFISYDAVRYFENIPNKHASDDAPPDFLFRFYRIVLIFDHQKEIMRVYLVVDSTADPLAHYQAAQEKLAHILKKINDISERQSTKKSIEKKSLMPPDVDIDDAEFMQLVERTKKFIEKGDAFQIVISRSFQQSYTVKPFDIYRSLRRISPAPYMFYLPFDDSVLIGASPERMVTIQNRKLTISPIAGTRRHTKQSIDADIEKDLLSDQKELAEHMMLVDLARNDVGAVCEPGTVKVEHLSQVKHFSHVSHIISDVTGTLKKDKDVFDALAAAFPAGTLSGAPKIRAMEIIDEIENSRRGLYGGAICVLDNEGNMESCIAIRMAVLKNGIATVRAGAGIVYDSNPMAEAQETINKARSILEAISMAHEE